MARKYIKKNVKRYTEDDIKNAMKAVQKGMKVFTAAQQFGVPRGTLRSRLDGRQEEDDEKPAGKNSIFTSRQEHVMKERVLLLCDRGFPITVSEFRSIAYEYAKKLKRRGKLNLPYPQKWDDEKKPGLEWYFGFRNRHPELCLRIPQGLSMSRSQAFNEERVENFHADLKNLYDQFQMYDYPTLIYNADETGLSSVPNCTSKVIARKGAKRIDKLQIGERGTLTTYLACANAAGDLIPPFFVFKGGPPVASSVLTHAHLASSKSGYIDSDLFLHFLNHFDTHRKKVPGKKTFLFLDGHTSHVGIGAVTFAIAHEIELICLPPHTTHRLQPLDTNFNKPLKTLWRKEVDAFLKDTDNVSLSKTNFLLVFHRVWMALQEKRGNIVNGFQHCGLYPLKNTIEKHEYAKCSSFCSVEKGIVESETNELQRILPLPQKKENPSHTKRHFCHLTKALPTNQFSNLRGNKKNSLRKKSRYINEQSTSASNKNAVPVSKRMKNSKWSRIDEQPTSTARLAKKDATHCCVCGSSWSGATEDWLKCVDCGKWACETCYGVNTCANCD
jgi:hypothetical protein